MQQQGGNKLGLLPPCLSPARKQPVRFLNGCSLAGDHSWRCVGSGNFPLQRLLMHIISLALTNVPPVPALPRPLIPLCSYQPCPGASSGDNNVQHLEATTLAALPWLQPQHGFKVGIGNKGECSWHVSHSMACCDHMVMTLAECSTRWYPFPPHHASGRLSGKHGSRALAVARLLGC